MPSLRDLKKRLQSVRTTGQLAGAMRTAATAKYSRAGARLNAAAPYAEAARELLRLAERASCDAEPPKRKRRNEQEEDALPPIEKKRRAILLLSGNRGLCGGYNHELFNYFGERLKEYDEPPVILVCGRMAEEYCRERGLEILRSFTASDVPSYAQAKEIAEELTSLYSGGGYSDITIVYQRFINMLKQEPDTRRFLPVSEEKDEAAEHHSYEMPLFIPDAATVTAKLSERCLAAETYSLLLSCASGAQAATLMAMRSAYDNANASAKMLETAINRRRQAKVTESVIETSSYRNET